MSVRHLSLKVAGVLCAVCRQLWLVAGLVTGWWNLRMCRESVTSHTSGFYIPPLTTIVICRFGVELYLMCSSNDISLHKNRIPITYLIVRKTAPRITTINSVFYILSELNQCVSKAFHRRIFC